jgi:hypothetical protein
MRDRQRATLSFDTTKRFLLGLLLLSLTGCSTQTTGGRWRIWAWIVLLLVLGVVTVLLISAIVAWQKRMARLRYEIELHNAGNVASRYALQAEAPQGGLDFLFMLRGMALHGGSVTGTQETVIEDRDGGGSKKTSPRVNAKRGKGLLNFASTISGLLISVGNLLPYNVGVHFIRIGSKLRRGQGTAERMGRMSGQMSRQVGQVGGKGNASSRSDRPTSPEPAPISSWVETPSVSPGETLTLELVVSPENPYRAQRLSCLLRSRSTERDSDVAPAPQLMRHDVELTGLTPFQKYSPFLLLLIGVISVLIAALMLIGG